MTGRTTRSRVPACISRNWFEGWRDPREFFCNAWGQIKPLIGHAPHNIFVMPMWLGYSRKSSVIITDAKSNFLVSKRNSQMPN
jgi:hypothetical protein